MGRILKDEHEHDEEDESYFFTVLLVLVLGCSPIAHYYTKVRCLCADVKISSQWPEHLDPETENFNKS